MVSGNYYKNYKNYKVVQFWEEFPTLIYRQHVKTKYSTISHINMSVFEPSLLWSRNAADPHTYPTKLSYSFLLRGVSAEHSLIPVGRRSFLLPPGRRPTLPSSRKIAAAASQRQH